MLNILWSGMILAGIIYAVFNGTIGDVNEALVESAKEAVTLCITMLGVMGLWTGIMEIAKTAGIVRGMTRLLNPVIKFLFPGIPEGHPAKEYISSNIIANILGLGWAATPMGLKAMEELKKLDDERLGESAGDSERRSRASDEMCTLLIINISSLQLIPVNVIAYRSQYGSTNPTGIIGFSMAATIISTLVAVVFCKLVQLKKKVEMTKT